ncbi:MAG: glutamate--tRNA ligase [Myxococcota bacterium]
MPAERTRFAPAPSGYLHIGNVRTALLNYIVAKKSGGEFILRVEDTDARRATKEATDAIESTLSRLGIPPDESPSKGGKRAPYVQSQRLSLYHDAATRLMKEGRAYYCYCSDAELEEMRLTQRAAGKKPRYDNRCRNLTEKRKSRYESEGRKPAIRLALEPEKLSFDDLIHGTLTFDLADEGDPVLIRSNGAPTYLMAASLDDGLMGITTVIRGEDLLPVTARQIALIRFLGFSPPRYAHHGLLMGVGGKPLSKRHGDTSALGWLERGVHPEALCVFIAALGASWSEGVMPKSMEEVMSALSMKNISASSVVFEPHSLVAFNKKFINHLPIERAINEFAPFWGEALAGEKLDDEQLRLLADLTRDSVENLNEVATFVKELLDDKPEFDKARLDKLREEEGRRVIAALKKAVAEGARSETLIDRVKAITGLKGRGLFEPLRIALTGKEEGAPLASYLNFLGLKRIERRINYIEGLL